MPDSKIASLVRISQIDLNQDLTKILEEILITVGRQIGGNSGSILLDNEAKTTEELEIVATFGLPGDYLGKVYRSGIPGTDNPSGIAFGTVEYYTVPNVFEEPQDKWLADIGRELGISAQLFVPMKRGEKVIGLLHIGMVEPHEYTQDEIDFVRIAASHTAAIVENARLSAEIDKEKPEPEREAPDHRSLEELLWEKKEILSKILSASPVGIGIVRNRTLSWTNERMLELMGFKPGDDAFEYVGQSAEIIYASKEEYERVGRIFYEELKGGNIAEVDAKLKRVDGSLFDGHIIMSFLDPSNPMEGAIATISDITFRKQAEEKLRESEERFRSLIQNAADIFILLDPEGTVLYLSDSVEKILGYKPSDLIGKNCFAISHSDDLAAAQAVLAQLIQYPEKNIEGVLRVLRPDGAAVYLEFVAKNHFNNPKVQGIVVNARDITARIKMEEAMRESEKRFHTFFDNLPVGVALIGANDRVLAANKVLCTFLGYTHEELVGMFFSKITPPGDQDMSQDLYESLIKGERDSFWLDKKYARRDGATVWGRLFYSGVRGSEGCIQYSTVICEDITKYKRIQEDLVYKKIELESAILKVKQIEEALKRSEKKYKEIAEFLPDLIYKSILLDA